MVLLARQLVPPPSPAPTSNDGGNTPPPQNDTDSDTIGTAVIPEGSSEDSIQDVIVDSVEDTAVTTTVISNDIVVVNWEAVTEDVPEVANSIYKVDQSNVVTASESTVNATLFGSDPIMISALID